jgi:hypothetical protein
MRILLVDQSLDFCAWAEAVDAGQPPRQEHRARRIQRRAAEIS